MRESRTYGSVRGALRDERPYRVMLRALDPPPRRAQGRGAGAEMIERISSTTARQEGNPGACLDWDAGAQRPAVRQHSSESRQTVDTCDRRALRFYPPVRLPGPTIASNSPRLRTASSRRAAKSMAGGLGFEPRLTESEFAVLPLNYPPIGKGRQEVRPSASSSCANASCFDWTTPSGKEFTSRVFATAFQAGTGLVRDAQVGKPGHGLKGSARLDPGAIGPDGEDPPPGMMPPANAAWKRSADHRLVKMQEAPTRAAIQPDPFRQPAWPP